MKLLYLKATAIGGQYFSIRMRYESGWWFWRRTHSVAGKVFVFDRDRAIVVRVEALLRENAPNKSAGWRAKSVLSDTLVNWWTVHGMGNVDWLGTVGTSVSTGPEPTSGTPTTF